MPIHIHMRDILLWPLNLPMEWKYHHYPWNCTKWYNLNLEGGLLTLGTIIRFWWFWWLNVMRVKTEIEGWLERGESVTNPILIVGGKMKGGLSISVKVVIKWVGSSYFSLSSCGILGFFCFFLFFLSFSKEYLYLSATSLFLPTTHLTSLPLLFIRDLLPPKLLKQTTDGNTPENGAKHPICTHTPPISPNT